MPTRVIALMQRQAVLDRFDLELLKWKACKKPVGRRVRGTNSEPRHNKKAK